MVDAFTALLLSLAGGRIAWMSWALTRLMVMRSTGLGMGLRVLLLVVRRGSLLGVHSSLLSSLWLN